MQHVVKRTPGELREALSDQVQLLLLSAANFDAGATATGRQLATTLRTLLYAPDKPRRGNRTSPLLHQLGLTGHRFLDTAYSIAPDKLSLLVKDRPSGPIPACGLLGVQMNAERASFFAPLDDAEPANCPSVQYPTWWTSAVLRDVNGKTASRLDLVRHVADTDGGAHVDDALDADYDGWAKGLTLGWAYKKGDAPPVRLKDLALYCMRQIAHEVLRTLAGPAPWAFPARYEYPQRPSLPPGASSLVGVSLAGNPQLRFDGSDLVLTSTA